MKYPNIHIEMIRGGFTMSGLAARLGLPLNTFIYKLYGKIEFTLNEIESLADLFDCSLDYLVGHMRPRNWQRVYKGCRQGGTHSGNRWYLGYPALLRC